MATAQNNVTVDFDTGTSGDDATHFRLFDGNLTSSARLLNVAVTGNPDALTANQYFRIASGGLVITLNTGSDADATDAGLRRALDGVVRGGLHVQLYSSSTAANSTDKTATGVVTERQEIEESEWDVA